MKTLSATAAVLAAGLSIAASTASARLAAPRRRALRVGPDLVCTDACLHPDADSVLTIEDLGYRWRLRGPRRLRPLRFAVDVIVYEGRRRVKRWRTGYTLTGRRDLLVLPCDVLGDLEPGHTYRVVVFVDSLRDVRETNERNNTTVRTVRP